MATTTAKLSNEARDLYAAHPPIDLHADTLMWTRWIGYDMNLRHTPPLYRAALGGHVDIPRLQEARMRAQFFGLVSLPIAAKMRGLAQAVHDQIDALDAAVAESNGKLRHVRTAEQLRVCQSEAAIGAFLGIEGAHALEGNLANLDAFARRGVRYLGLLHFSANEAGHPAYGRGRQDDRGLTTWGFELVQRCEELGVLVDLAHINKAGYLDACRVSRKPVIVSHTGVLGAFEHWRNVDDEQLRAVADRGGCIGVIFCPQFLGADGLDAVVAHIQHILNVVGEDVPALGSDWDGFIIPTRGLSEPTGLPNLVEALLRAGVSERAVGKVLSGNVLRVLNDM